MIFDKQARLITAVGVSTTQVIAAPGAGLSIYLQTVSMTNPSAATLFYLENGGSIFASGVVPGAGQSLFYTFPGGFKLGANNAFNILVNTAGVVLDVACTYTVGPA